MYTYQTMKEEKLTTSRQEVFSFKKLLIFGRCKFTSAIIITLGIAEGLFCKTNYIAKCVVRSELHPQKSEAEFRPF